MRSLLLIVLLLASVVAHAEDSVVLVASADSPLAELSTLEVRKIYLGIGVARQGMFVRALRNESSARVQRIFLQNVVGLTEMQYERRLLVNLLNSGSIRPGEYSDIDQLIEAIQSSPMSVSYLLIRDDQVPPDLKVLRVLWAEQ